MFHAFHVFNKFMRSTFRSQHGIHDTLEVQFHHLENRLGTPSFTIILGRGENHLPSSEPPFLNKRSTSRVSINHDTLNSW